MAQRVMVEPRPRLPRPVDEVAARRAELEEEADAYEDALAAADEAELHQRLGR